MQDLTPASRGQTPTTPGQLQPTLANPSRSWPAPARFSQLQPGERRPETESPYPRPALVPQPQLITATRQPTAGQSVPAPGATKSRVRRRRLLNPSCPQKLTLFLTPHAHRMFFVGSFFEIPHCGRGFLATSIFAT